MRDSKKRLSSGTQHVLRDCPSGNSSIAREQRRSTPRKLEYALSRQLGRGRLGGGPHPFDLAQSPRVHSGLGLFLAFCTTHCSGHFRSIRSKINAACLIAFSTTANFAGLALSESMSISFRAQSSVAAKRIAYFLSSVIGFPAHWDLRVEVGCNEAIERSRTRPAESKSINNRFASTSRSADLCSFGK